MAFWSTERILQEQKKCPLISEFAKERLKYGRYSLRLSREVLVTPDGTTNAPNSGEGSHVKIPPGQFAMLYAMEFVSVPDHAVGFISVRTSEKFKGLVNVSGFHVDPGFKGHLKFSVYNAGNNCICLDYESECFLLWFCSLDKPTEDTWDKKNQAQRCLVTASDHEQLGDRRHSPAALHARIQKLEDSVNAIMAVGVVIIFPLLIAFGVTTFEGWFAKTIDRNKITYSALIVGTSFVTSLVSAMIFWALRYQRTKGKR